MYVHSCEVPAVADSDPVQRPRQAETPTIRVREPADDLAIATTITAAFAGPGETALVKSLRHDGDMSLELVAQMDNQIVGHIAYSRLSVASPGATLNAVARAPLSVSPNYQRRGVGSALIKTSITHLKRQDVERAVCRRRIYGSRAHARQRSLTTLDSHLPARVLGLTPAIQLAL